MSFKDLSIAVLAKLLEILLFVSQKKGQEKRAKILVGTAGDTGPASAHSVANLEKVDLVLLYPLNRVSKIQELQMLTVKAPNVHICAGNKRNINMIIIRIFLFLSFCHFLKLREVPTMETNPSKNVSKTSTSQRPTVFALSTAYNGAEFSFKQLTMLTHTSSAVPTLAMRFASLYQLEPPEIWPVWI